MSSAQYGSGRNPQASGGNAAPTPRDVFESQFSEIASYYGEYKSRLYETQGVVENAFNLMDAMLVGSNTTAKLRELYSAVPDNYPYLGTTALQPHVAGEVKEYAKRLIVDTSGWDIEAKITDPKTKKVTTFKNESGKVDRVLSYANDLYMHMIDSLSKAHDLQNPQLTRRPDYVQEQTGMQQVRTEPPRDGIISRFLQRIGLSTPQWRMDYEHGMSLMRDIFDDYNITKMRWEDYKRDHWTNSQTMVMLQPDNRVAMVMDELEALDDVRTRINRLLDSGTRLLYMQNSAEMSKMAQMIIQAKGDQSSPPPKPNFG